MGLLLPLSACEPTDDTGPSKGADKDARSDVKFGCHVKPNNPHESGLPGDKRGDIVGKVQFWCDKPVDRVVGLAKLQRKDGGQWVDVPSAVGREPKRNPKVGKKYVAQGITACKEGTYRTAGFGYAYRDGKLSEMKDWKHSRAVTNPCEKS